MADAVLIGVAFVIAAALVFAGAALLRAGFIHLIGGRRAAIDAIKEG